jgi:hypothetical protein
VGPTQFFRIIPEGGYHAVVDQDGRTVISGLDLRNDREALRAIEDLAAEKGLLMSVVRSGDGRIDRIEVRPKPNVHLRITVSAELDGILGEMAEFYGTSKEGVVLNAIGLLRLAFLARREGKGVAIIDQDGEIDQEIEGV